MIDNRLDEFQALHTSGIADSDKAGDELIMAAVQHLRENGDSIEPREIVPLELARERLVGFSTTDTDDFRALAPVELLRDGSVVPAVNDLFQTPMGRRDLATYINRGLLHDLVGGNEADEDRSYLGQYQEMDDLTGRAAIAERHPEAIFADGFDDAIVGVSEGRVDVQVIYDIEECFWILAERDSMSRAEAREYLEYNVISAYVGPNTPIFMQRY